MAISKYLPFKNKLATSSKGGYFFRLMKNYPKFSFGLSIIIAMIGILFFFVFPVLFLFLPVELYETIIQAKELKDWIDAGILLLVIILAGAFSWTIYNLKFSIPTGLDVTKEKFPHF